VLATPLIRALRETYPDAHLGVLVRPYAGPVLEDHPGVDRVLVDDAEGRDRGPGGFWSLVGRVRAERFQVSLMLLPTRRHALVALLAGIRTRIGVGRKTYEVLTGHRPAGQSRGHPVRHEADYCLDLGRAIGAEHGSLRSEVFVDTAERQKARRRLVAAGVTDGPLVGIHPGSGGSAPNWRMERYADLAGRIVDEIGAWVVVTGDGTGEVWSGPCGRRGGGGVVDLIGRLDLRELMGTISGYDAMLSSSTGPMHVAASLGVPCVALFCPRPACCPERWGPLGTGHRVLLPRDGCLERCGPVRDPACTLEQISVEEAFGAVEGVLAGT